MITTSKRCIIVIWIEEKLRIFAIVMDMALHFFDIVSLKIKIASYFTRKKWVYLGIAENCNSGQTSYRKL